MQKVLVLRTDLACRVHRRVSPFALAARPLIIQFQGSKVALKRILKYLSHKVTEALEYKLRFRKIFGCHLVLYLLIMRSGEPQHTHRLPIHWFGFEEKIYPESPRGWGSRLLSKNSDMAVDVVIIVIDKKEIVG